MKERKMSIEEMAKEIGKYPLSTSSLATKSC
jgi:hypothetical protein